MLFEVRLTGPEEPRKIGFDLVAGPIESHNGVGVVSGHVREEPIGVRKLVSLIELHLALNREVTALTETREVPPPEVGLVAVEVVDGNNPVVADLGVVRTKLVAQNEMVTKPRAAAFDLVDSHVAGVER